MIFVLFLFMLRDFLNSSVQCLVILTVGIVFLGEM